MRVGSALLHCRLDYVHVGFVDVEYPLRVGLEIVLSPEP
jgi:hypothetical protein